MVISRICSLFISLCCATVLYQSVFPSYFDLCMSGAPSGSSGDPRREFEANWGERGTRGIRGGKAARRKRDAFRRYESERLGIPIDQVAVVHQGGQSRPLYTSPYWIPDQSDPEVVSSDEAVEAVEAPESDRVTSVVDLTQLGFYGRLSQATPEVQRLVPRSKLFSQVRVSPYNPLLRPRPSSGPSSSSSAAPPEPASIPPTIRPQGIEVDDSVRIFVPIVSDGRYQLKEVTQTLRRIEGPIVAVDYHQVLDIDRSERPWVSISDEGLLPERNVHWFRYINQKLHDIAGPRQSSSLLCVLSFVHSEERLRSSLRAIEKSRLKTGAVIFTRTPVGRGGKADTLKGILHPEVSPARVVLVDDRLETIREAVQLNQFGIHVQVKRKPQPSASELKYQIWSVRSLRESVNLVEQVLQGRWDS